MKCRFRIRLASILTIMLLQTACVPYLKTASDRVLVRDENNQLLVLDTDGQVTSRLNVLVKDAKWSPDGKRIAVWDRDSNIAILEPQTGHTIYLAKRNAPYRGAALAWSPDGRKIAFTAQSDVYTTTQLSIFDTQNISTTFVWQCKYECKNPIWMSDNMNVIMSEDLPATYNPPSARVIEVNTSTRQMIELFSVDQDIEAMRWDLETTQQMLSSHNEGIFLRTADGIRTSIKAHSVGDFCWLQDSQLLVLNQNALSSIGTLKVLLYRISDSQMYDLYPSQAAVLTAPSVASGYVLDCR